MEVASSSLVARSKKHVFVQVLFFLEVLARFELADQSFADSCLTTWLQYHMKSGTRSVPDFGAGDEARTRYLHLGKVALYRMSYTRILAPDWEPYANHISGHTQLVPPVGIEPTTRGFSVHCSTD